MAPALKLTTSCEITDRLLADQNGVATIFEPKVIRLILSVWVSYRYRSEALRSSAAINASVRPSGDHASESARTTPRAVSAARASVPAWTRACSLSENKGVSRSRRPSGRKSR